MEHEEEHSIVSFSSFSHRYLCRSTSSSSVVDFSSVLGIRVFETAVDQVDSCQIVTCQIKKLLAIPGLLSHYSENSPSSNEVNVHMYTGRNGGKRSARIEFEYLESRNVP